MGATGQDHRAGDSFTLVELQIEDCELRFALYNAIAT